MKRLILMRHGKSDWGDPLQEDHERPLNARGVASAKALADWLRAEKIFPDEAQVSFANRTMQTFDHLGITCQRHIFRRLYLAPPFKMLDILKSAREDTVLMIGHNPGMAELASDLMQTAPAHPRFDDYPTCATLVARFDINDWADLRPGTGVAEHFILPRELLA